MEHIKLIWQIDKLVIPPDIDIFFKIGISKILWNKIIKMYWNVQNFLNTVPD